MKKLLLSLIICFLAITLKAQTPSITSFSPAYGSTSVSVTITGTNFNATASNNIVFFGATKAAVTASTATSITATVPTGATYAPITVLNTGSSLAAYSRANFNPTYSPAKTNITLSDFNAKQDFATGTNPYSVAIGDLDGDGKPDLVVANYNSNTVSVYRNTSSLGSISSGSFAAPVDFGTGTSPRSVAIGDLDGDGKPDLAVANRGTNTVSVYRNTSSLGSITSASFAAKVDFAAGTTPNSVAIGDLDGDGKPDLAVANEASNTISVFRNTSSSGVAFTSGSFATKVDFATGTKPYSVAISDLDGDGKPDLAVANYGVASVSIIRNTSSSGVAFTSGSFAAPVDFGTGTNPASLAIGDLDGDGKPDLAVANYTGNTVSIIRNTSSSGVAFTSGSFAAKVDFATGGNPYSVTIGDLDGNGKPDLAVASSASGNVSVFLNTSASGIITSASFAAKVDFATGAYPLSVAIGDLDGDGKPDLAAANYSSNTVSVIRNADLPPVITSLTPLSAKPGDVVTLTGTGFNTIATSNIVFFGATKASVTASTATSITVTVPTGATYAPITLLNKGTALAAYSLANFNPIYSPAKTNIATTDFNPKQDFATGTHPYSVAIGDLDGDGKPDLAVANYASNTISVYRNTSSSGIVSSGSFAAKVDFATGTNPISVAIGDLDGDGKPDLAVANSGSNNVSVIRNNASNGSISSGSFAAKVDFAAGTTPYSVAISDLDGDGKPDLAVANEASNTVSVFRNTSSSGSISSGSFAAKVDFATGSSPYSVAIGDLDGDGKPDMAVANFSSNKVSVFRNTSGLGSITTASFAAKFDFATASPPTSVTIGDLDGDGKLDLAVTNVYSNTVSVFRNTSSLGSITTGSFAARIDFTTGDFPRSVVIGDLDGDGKPDLLVANKASNNVSVFRNTSTSGSISSASFAAKVDFTTGTDSYSVAIGDLDGDGKPDLAVANYSSNTVSVIRNADIIYPPVITSFTPLRAKPGDVVTLTGTGFNTTPANNVVFFGAISATVTAATAISLTVTVPAGATHSVISVMNTSTNLLVYSQKQFLPTFTPKKDSFTPADFAAKLDFATQTKPGYIALGDLDGDGKVDMAVTNESDNTVSLFLNTSTSGSPTYAARIDLTTGAQPEGVAIGDIDGDGKLDIAVTNFNANSVSIYRNTSTVGSLNFAVKVDYALGSCPFFVVIRDINGDGRADLVTANKDANTISIVLNTGVVGTISFATAIDLSTGAGSKPYAVTVGDLDGDGKPDIAAAGYGTNVISVFRSIGTIGSASFATKQDFPVTTPYSISIGDLDGDGLLDLATANFMNNTISVFKNTSTSGTINFGAKADLSLGSQTYSVAIGDINGDGKPDLVVPNYANDNVSIFSNTSSAGSIAFASREEVATGVGPDYVAIGDMDGDGKSDLVVANYTANTVSVLRNKLIAISTSGTLAALSTTYNAGASATSTSFTVSASNLLTGITITPPTGFELSQTAGGTSGYAGKGTAITVGAAGTVATTTIYVRLAAGNVGGIYSNNTSQLCCGVRLV